MRRVLVPLDGTKAAETVMPEAMRVAGPRGHIVLMHDVVAPPPSDRSDVSPEALALERSEGYLEGLVSDLRSLGMQARAETFVISDTSYAIGEAARIFGIDVIACTTEARSGLKRLLHPSVAWNALAHGATPVLMHHTDGAPRQLALPTNPVKLLVPLDGSELAETALPLAMSLARQWHAELLLTRVAVPVQTTHGGPIPSWTREIEQEAEHYLVATAGELSESVALSVDTGPVVDTLARSVATAGVTHVVMASHGRTGVARVVLGSVADELVHRLSVPIIIVPALATVHVRKPDALRQPEMQPA